MSVIEKTAGVAVRFCVFLFVILFSACSDDDKPVPAPQQLAVTYANLAGEWELVSFNSTALAEGTYMRLTFDRREHTFTMSGNLQSMYGQQRTGRYTLGFDDDSETYVLSGSYDNGVGEWAHKYTVTSLTANELQLTTVDAPHEVTVYKRPSSQTSSPQPSPQTSSPQPSPSRERGL